jgi:hypothetical protein
LRRHRLNHARAARDAAPALVWPLRLASQVSDQSIARRARWTLPPLTLVAESFSHALAEAHRAV